MLNFANSMTTSGSVNLWFGLWCQATHVSDFVNHKERYDETLDQQSAKRFITAECFLLAGGSQHDDNLIVDPTARKLSTDIINKGEVFYLFISTSGILAFNSCP